MAKSIRNTAARAGLNGIQVADDVRITAADIDNVVTGILDAARDGTLAVDSELLDRLETLSSSIPAEQFDRNAIDGIRMVHIPAVQDQLDAIVTATETAADAIMAASEQIENLTESVDAPGLDQLAEHVAEIFQACSFQDITGQRTTKIAAELENIAAAADLTLAAMGDDSARRRGERRQAEASRLKMERGEESDLLNGPQLRGGGNSQDEIDNILASFD